MTTKDSYRRALCRRMGAVICLLLPLSGYLLTLAPTVQPFDSAELTVAAYTLGFVHAPGYPLYMLLGHGWRYLPLGNVGWRYNALSAIFAALTTWGLFHLTYEDDRSLWQRLPPILLLASAPLFWSQALRAEVYTLQSALVVGVLYLWYRAHRTGNRAAYLGCFVLLGFGQANHSTTLFLWTALLLSLIWESSSFHRLTIVGCLLSIILVTGFYLYFPLRAAFDPTVDYIQPYFNVDLSTLKGVWWLFSSQMFRHAFYLDHSLIALVNEIVDFISLIWGNFLGIGALLGLWGWWEQRKSAPAWHRLLSIYFLVNWIGFVAYHVVDKAVMFIPALLIWTIWVVEGLKAVINWLHWRLPNTNRDIINCWAGGVLSLLVGLGVIFNAPQVSLRNNHRTYTFATNLLAQAPPNTLVVSHWATASVFDYLRIVEGQRPDVESFNMDFFTLALQERYDDLEAPAVQAAWERWLDYEITIRPVCFITPLSELPERYHWEKQGACWMPVITN
jgi:hypothetical protein